MIDLFFLGSRVRQTPEDISCLNLSKRCGNNNKDEDNSPKNLNDKNRRTYRPKRRENNNKDEDNIPKTLKDKKHQASSQKFRQLIYSEF